ncbi:MAG: hypothetical protein IRZ16_11470 [Myxococcaceae bacterium]|nr:hypothetical protein [Myxococcaceae bacterium]
MAQKSGTGTVAVTAEEVRSALGRARTVTSEEEKVLRMRHGVGARTLTEPLPHAAAGNEELEDELLVIEMQLQRAWRMRMAEEKARSVPAVAPRASKTKDKIVRALRKKK